MVKAVYREIIDYLKEVIKKKNPGEKLPSENELARMFNVSRMTARKAVDTLALEGYVVRVPGMGTYVSDMAKRNKMIHVGVAIYDFSDLRGQTMLSSIIRTLLQFSMHPIPVNIIKGRTNREELEILLEFNVEALIISPSPSIKNSVSFKKVVSRGIPIVFVDRYVDGLDFPSVTSNNYHGGVLLGEHMRKKHGVRKALFVTEEDLKVSSVRERYEGFKEGLDGEVLYFELTADNTDLLIETVRENKIDTIFFCHDLLAVKGITLLMKNGFRIPEDVKIVSFDDRAFSKHVIPNLTTVKQDFEKMGRMAALMISKLLKGEKVNKIEHIPVELIIRNSCGCE
ncbi:MAG: substrate-binding domain-containing protein [Thermotogae bacterium]|nr:substrate-binding domain-containing protein [Thermotogota bacterium]